MTPEQIERFLSEPIYSWNVSNFLSGIVDFLDFSERNISWQREREVRRARDEASSLEFEPSDAHFLAQARDQIVESAELRFDIGISQSVRYAGLTSFVTAIEWCMRAFVERLDTPLSPKPPGKNETVHNLRQIAHRSNSNVAVPLQDFIHANTIRNCVVHAAGIVPNYRYQPALRKALSSIRGFGTSTDGLLGEVVHIQSGAVDALAREALVWVPELDKQCSNNGVFRPAA